MPCSMTGFGRTSSTSPRWNLVWEIASRNARYLELKWKLPPGWTACLQRWENTVRQAASRGTVELNLTIRLLDPEAAPTTLDGVQAAAMVRSLQTLAANLGIPADLSLTPLLGVAHLWRDPRTEGIPEDLVQDAERLLEDTLQVWNASRRQEGAALVQDLAARLKHLHDLAQAIASAVDKAAPLRLAALTQRIQTLLDGTELPDPARIHQELALLADKVDVSEELTRLAAHLQVMDKLLTEDGPMGRKLDFLVQEVLREITTCSNKAASAAVSGLAVDFKTELEKFREQVQNLE